MIDPLLVILLIMAIGSIGVVLRVAKSSLDLYKHSIQKEAVEEYIELLRGMSAESDR